ncbi:hypothetical protein SH2C18_24090 [Clostridium sediminicola]|uniref:polysaccharide deacetylase family protein n=1 Tax=Clostridium sediminicola TaxID=3114879 RepID=UPI0031F22418
MSGKQKKLKFIVVVIVCISLGIGFVIKNIQEFRLLKSKTESLNGNHQEIYKYEKAKVTLKVKLENEYNKKELVSLYSRKSIEEILTKLIPSKQNILPILGTSEKLSSKQKTNMSQWRDDIVKFAQKNRKDVFISGSNKKKIALTFDDGPDNIITPMIIGILKDNNIKGNFFFLGEKIERYPEVVKQAYENGNIIASHGYYHNELTKYDNDKINEEMQRTTTLIKEIIGKKPLFIRPAYGDINDRVLSVLNKNQVKTILWSLDALDWSLRERDAIIKNVIDNVRNGDIILLHSNADKIETAKALETIILELKSKNYEIVDLETLLKIKAYEK